MDNAGDSLAAAAADNSTQENQNPESPPETTTGSNSPSRQPSRTPFTSLGQVDADLALARTLQEQERAYLMLTMNGGDGGGHESSDGGSYVYEDEEGVEAADPNDDEDAFDALERVAADHSELGADVDPSVFYSDEAYARALQNAEEREIAARLMALVGVHDWGAEDLDDRGRNSQETWQEIDPDELSYEELVALGEVVGTESRGLSAETIASLPSTNYKVQRTVDGNTDQCVICRWDFEDGDALIVLTCKHAYHSECINNWLQINKVCPVCNAEVSTIEDRQGSAENLR